LVPVSVIDKTNRSSKTKNVILFLELNGSLPGLSQNIPHTLLQVYFVRSYDEIFVRKMVLLSLKKSAQQLRVLKYYSKITPKFIGTYLDQFWNLKTGLLICRDERCLGIRHLLWQGQAKYPPASPSSVLGLCR